MTLNCLPLLFVLDAIHVCRYAVNNQAVALQATDNVIEAFAEWTERQSKYAPGCYRYPVLAFLNAHAHQSYRTHSDLSRLVT